MRTQHVLSYHGYFIYFSYKVNENFSLNERGDDLSIATGGFLIQVTFSFYCTMHIYNSLSHDISYCIYGHCTVSATGWLPERGCHNVTQIWVYWHASPIRRSMLVRWVWVYTINIIILKNQSWDEGCESSRIITTGYF